MAAPQPRILFVYITLASLALVLVAWLAVRVAGPMAELAADGASDPGRAAMGHLGCLSCHSVAGQGGNLGPELGSELAARGEPWIHDYITSGQNVNVYPGNGHQAFTTLNAEQARLLAAYLAHLSVSARYHGPAGSR